MLAAIRTRDILAMRSALESGADPNYRTPADSEPLLTTCAILGYGPESQLLMGYGADANAKDSHGNTALAHLALQGLGDSHYGVFEMLIQHGADINARNKKGFAPIDYAARAAVAEIRDFGARRDDSSPRVAQMMVCRLLSIGARVDRHATRAAVSSIDPRIDRRTRPGPG